MCQRYPDVHILLNMLKAMLTSKPYDSIWKHLCNIMMCLAKGGVFGDILLYPGSSSIRNFLGISALGAPYLIDARRKQI